MWGDVAIAFILAFIVAFMATPYTIKIAHKVGAVDVPKDERRMHKRAMPKFGGPAVILGFLVSVIYLLIVMSLEDTIILNGPENYGMKLIGLFLGIVIISITCIIDDIKTIKPIVKLSGQLLAAIVGLEALKKPCNVELTSDSKYLVDAFKQKWVDGWVKKGWRGSNKQPVKNQDLWKRLLKAKEPHNVKFIWVKGHNGHEFNERCDEMAVASANGENLLDDTGCIQ